MKPLSIIITLNNEMKMIMVMPKRSNGAFRLPYTSELAPTAFSTASDPVVYFMHKVNRLVQIGSRNSAFSQRNKIGVL